MKFFSILVSYLFHPLFVILYMLGFLVVLNPFLFPYREPKQLGLIFLIVFFTATLIPLISVLLMKAVGIIDSMEMTNKSDRIGPLIVVIICYLWLYLNIRTNNMIPQPFSIFTFGALISVCVAFFLNNFNKISLHAVAAGGLLCAVFLVCFLNNKEYIFFIGGEDLVFKVHILVPLCLSLVITGLVMSSRLYLKAHNYLDVWGGLLVGIVGQIFALRLF